MMRFGILSVGVLAMVLSAVGCADQEKVNLKTENESLRKALDSARAEDAKSVSEASRLANEAAAKDAEIAKLKSDLAKKGPTGAAPSSDGGAKTAGTAAGWQSMTIGDKVTLDSDILFSAGKAELTAEGKKHMDKVADDIRKSYSGMPVRVYGYTDTDPIKKTKDLWLDNLDLSLARAAAVTRYLEGKGIKASSIETIGMGENYPIGTNKAKSRRVEIIVIKSKAAAAPAKAAGKAADPVPEEYSHY